MIKTEQYDCKIYSDDNLIIRGRMSAPKYTCDRCDIEGDLYSYKDMELCHFCYMEAFADDVTPTTTGTGLICEWCCEKTDELYDYNGEQVCLDCLLDEISETIEPI